MKNNIDISDNRLPKRTSERNYGIDLLRCFAMAMIVTLHTLKRSGLLETRVLSARYEVVWFLEIFSYCAVNCFVLLSGYVSLNSKFRISRIISLWLQVVFYNVGLTVLLQAIDGDWNVASIIRAFLPVSTNSYWFFTQYFVLSFFMPFINKLVKTISLRHNAYLIGIMLFFFSLCPMLYAAPVKFFSEFDENLFYTGRGYSVLWFVVMYTCGAFIKRLSEENRLPKIPVPVLAGITLLSDIIIWLIHYVCVRHDRSHFFVIAYTSIFVVISTFSMVLLFSRFKFNKTAQKLIAFASSGAFAVYLIHSNKPVYEVYKDLVSPMADMRLIKMLPALLFTIVFVFVVCVIADWFRAQLFKLLRVDKFCRKFDKLIK